MIGLVVSLLSQAVALPAVPPVAPPVATRPDAGRHAKAVQLAQLLNPESKLVDESGDDYVKMTRQVLVDRGKLNDLEARYPGIIEAMLRASVPTVNAQMRHRVPILWDRLGDIYVAAFTVPELDQLLGFYRSPTGQRMLASLDARMKPKAMIKEMTRNDDLSVSADSFRSDLKDAIPGVVGDLGPADRIAVLTFMRTTAFAKIPGITGTVQQITLDWMQDESPDEEAQLQAVMRDAMTDYMKKRDAAQGPVT